MRFSASMISKWATCGLAAKFHYVDGLRGPQSASASFGVCVHEALEQYNDVDSGIFGDVEAAVDRFLETWAQPAILGVQPDIWNKRTSYAQLKETGVQCIRDYHETVRWSKREILAVEHKFIVPIGDHIIEGMVDSLEVDEHGVLEVIDFKTNGQRPNYDTLYMNSQMTTYWYASMQPEFWLGHGKVGDEYYRPPMKNGEELWERFGPNSERRAIWFHLRQGKKIDVGPRDDLDFMRLYRCMEEINKAIEREVFVPTISAEGCLWCLAGETKVLTRQGFKPIRSLAGQTVEVRTDDGKWIEAPIRSYGVQPLQKISLKRGKSSKVIYATPEHRWVVESKVNRKREFVVTSDLVEGNTLKSIFGQGVKGIDGFSIAGVQSGLVFGDGNKVRGGTNGSSITLYGHKRDLLDWFPGYTHSKYGETIVVSQMPAHFKDAPVLEDSKPYLYGWLAGYFAADGSISKTGACSISSANAHNLELVQDVCALLGIQTGEISSYLREGMRGKVEPLHKMTIRGDMLTSVFFLNERHKERFESASYNKDLHKHWIIKSVSDTDRVEEVFCAEVPDTHTFVIEGNILTGNCSHTDICPIYIPNSEEDSGWS